MTTVINTLAAGGEAELPLNGKLGPLAPANYDVVWSLVVLAILLLVFWKLILPKFQQVLDERAERIEGGIERAEAAQAQAKAALDQYNAQLAEARSEAARIREDARAQGQQIIDEMKAQAEEESARIVANGNQQLAAQRQQIVSELRGDMGRNAVDLAEKLMGEQLSENVKRSSSIDRFLTELDGVGSSSGK